MAISDIDFPERPRPAVCPACAVAPLVEHQAALPQDAEIMLSLPKIHCAACISEIERALSCMAGVTAARVNLTLRRAAVSTNGSIGVDDLIGALSRIGHEAHELDAGLLSTTAAARQERDLLMRLGVAFFAMMNVMILSVAVWSGAEGVTRDMMHWVSALIAFPAVIFAGRPFYVSAWSALRVGRMNMDVPITLAILLALVTSLYETIHSGHHAYFDAAVSLCFFLLGGRYLDFRTRAAARSAAEELSALEVPRALRLDAAGGEETVPAAELVAGDMIRLRPGGRVPVDGIVRQGQSELDRSIMTGESLPAAIGPNGVVCAGEVNLTGPLDIEVTAAGRDTSLARIADLVAMAEAGRGNYNSLADQATKLYAPLVHILAALSALAWYVYSQDMRLSLNIAAAVLIITCPCALGLAVPAVTTAASGKLFRKGMLIKHPTALERLSEVDVVVFDKTGTLTMGAPVLASVAGIGAADKALALALARASDHPLAQALRRGLEAEGIVAAPVTDCIEKPGFGVSGRFDGGEVRLGRAGWAGDADSTETATHLWREGASAVSFRFVDQMRAGAPAAVAGLKSAGLEVMLVSGDSTSAVAGFAARIGIKDVVAEARPEDKARLIADLAARGRKVLMVGDGLNDTAALAAAHVSISPATALDAARAASDIVLLSPDLAQLPQALALSRIARKRISENFTLATFYNVVAVPLAMAGMATPLVAALAMSLSSITVALNALRLR